jgi:hypothetical protein
MTNDIPLYLEAEMPVVDKIKGHYNLCPNIENNICATWWKHDHCEALRALLYDVTRESIYLRKDEDPGEHIKDELFDMLKDVDVAELLRDIENENNK